MKRIIFMALSLLLPLQGFCDYFWVCTHETIQHELNQIQESGGRVIEIQTTKINDYFVTYTIRYRTGA